MTPYSTSIITSFRLKKGKVQGGLYLANSAFPRTFSCLVLIHCSRSVTFLAIFSSNLDEFYRVRVATINRLVNLVSKVKEELGYNPKKILNQIKNIVVKQEKKFNALYEEIIKELADNKIFILNEHQLNVSRGQFVKKYFREKILSTIVPIIIDDKQPTEPATISLKLNKSKYQMFSFK